MRKNKTVVLGAAALCVGMLGFAGCNNQVMGKRNYVPATDTAVAPMPDAGTTTPQPLPAVPVKPTPAAQKSSSYAPMAPVASAPVTSVASSSAGSVSGKDGAASAGSAYTVKSGDTIGKIAQRHGVAVAALMQANDLDEAKARRIQIGRKLIIPGASGKAVQAAGKSAAGKETGKAAAAVVKDAVNADGTYTVQAGDFLGKISRKLGVKEADMMKANNLNAESAKRLQVGQKLVVPGKGAAASSATAASKAAPSKSTAPATSGAPAGQEKDPLDDVLIDSEVKAPAPAPTAGVAGKVDTALVEEKVVLPALSSVPAIVEADTTLTDFAAKHNVSADKIRELNPGLIPADGKLTKDLLLMIPGN